jgi:hypothetical protein
MYGQVGARSAAFSVSSSIWDYGLWAIVMIRPLCLQRAALIPDGRRKQPVLLLVTPSIESYGMCGGQIFSTLTRFVENTCNIYVFK